MKRFAPKNILIGLIRLYQKLRPAGTRGCCKYIPTCSQYGLEAVERFGALKGGLLALWRILRCNPLGKYGYDPVPEKGRWMNPERKLFREKR